MDEISTPESEDEDGDAEYPFTEDWL